jgi:cyclopropane fatty-acyl-phospholipid synthase-like methyltransferase
MIFFIIVGAIFIYIIFWYLVPFGRGAMYEPSGVPEVETIVKLANIKKGQNTVDIGSGDGRIVIAMAKKGAKSHGYEVNPFLVYRSRKNIKQAGLEKQAFIHWKSFWGINFSDFDVVVTFQVGYIMKKLEKKLFAEMKPGSLIISHYWTFPTIQPIKTSGEIHVYQVPELIEV